MGYSQLKKLKKIEDQSFEKSYIRRLVYVQDIFDLIVFKNLSEQYPDEVKFVAAEPILKESFLIRGPSGFRGADILPLLKQNFPDLNLAVNDFPSLFYKDSEWKDFTGRAKSEKLLSAEEFYTSRSISFELEAAFPYLAEDSFWNSLEKERLAERVINIRSQVATDMISPAHWALETGSGKVIECEELFFGGSPQKFLDLTLDKKPLSDSFMEFCESTRSSAELVIKFDFKSPLHQGGETFFIPLSYTHDWGHFIGEFKGNSAEFIHFFEQTETSEEDVSRKLKLLKKSLEKIFSDFNQKYVAEFLVVRAESGCLKIDDQLYSQIEAKPAHLHFIHRNAPLGFEMGGVSSDGDSLQALLFDARALLSGLSVLQKSCLNPQSE